MDATSDSLVLEASPPQCCAIHDDIHGRDSAGMVSEKDEIDGRKRISDNVIDGDQEDDEDCLLFYDDDDYDGDAQDGATGEVHEASCRRAYVAVHGPGVPVFLMGAWSRAGKGWAWLLAASSDRPARGRPAVGRVDYGPYRFYVGDVDARGLPDGYGAMVHTRTGETASAVGARCEKAAETTRESTRSWPAPSALLKWHEGFWRAGQRQGQGVNVCLEYTVAMEGCWRDDLFDGYGTRVYGRGRWVLLPDGSGNGRWSGGDVWRHCGHWRGGERHGTGVLTVAGKGRPFAGIWLNGSVTRDTRTSIHSPASPRP
ncbi:Morn repeat incomplete domain containing protein [Pandoravirus neocaledonia]|uniref:Morn repeat incomplete domain containing protein n=1 Tax=Pandoravirus neocaledonia TaxID=2107708 RepID=A0A2U7UBC9_9VIRU|nr:Morn repeat incomplete domain containing protein [Pandoravirus neocaledonia]AVK75692.1 Morn repeat incomplete domain containing protein [Pandoravirus neocaledonia]